MTPALAMFVAAMHGPGIGCTYTQFTNEYRRQEAGQPAVVVDIHASKDHWECSVLHPKHLHFDFNRDLTVDLRDFQILQNTWRKKHGS